jgi:hypothetical protein
MGTGFIKENASALALMGAGGAVVLAIGAISAAVQAMRDDFEKATKAIEEMNKAATDLERKEGEQQQRIEDIAASRKEGGFGSADAARQAGLQARRVEEKFRGVVGSEEIEKAAGFLGDKNVTDEELARVAFSLKRPGSLDLKPEDREASRQRAITQATGRDRAAFDMQAALEQTQATQAKQEAEKQALTLIGPQAALEDDVRKFLGRAATDKNVEDFTKLLRQFPTRGDFLRGNRMAISPKHAFAEPIDSFLRMFSDSFSAIPPEEERNWFPQAVSVTPEQYAQLGKLWARPKSRSGASNVTIHQTNNYQGQKNYGPDAGSQRGRMDNGDERVKSFEGWGP